MRVRTDYNASDNTMDMEGDGYDVNVSFIQYLYSISTKHVGT